LFLIGLLRRLEVLGVTILGHIQMGESFGGILIHCLEVTSDVENIVRVLVHSSPLILHAVYAYGLGILRTVPFLLADNVTHIHGSLTAEVCL